MPIESITGDIFDFAPQHCEACALWMMSGFSDLHTAWLHRFLPRLEGRTLSEWHAGEWHPAMLGLAQPTWWGDQPKLIQIDPPLGNLRVLYIHPNPDNSWVSDHRLIAPMVVHALEALSHHTVQKLAMNGIQAGLVKHDRRVDNIHAELMKVAIDNWLDEHGGHFEVVYLVDLEGGFPDLVDGQ